MDLARELEVFYSMVYAEHITCSKLVNLLIVIKEKCLKILQFASDYDYDPNHRFNGYRSTVLFVVKFLEAVHCTKLNEDFDGTLDEIIRICGALNKTLQSVLEFHERSLKHHSDQASTTTTHQANQTRQVNQTHQSDPANQTHQTNRTNQTDRIERTTSRSEDVRATDQAEVFKLQMPIDRQSLVDAFESMQDNDIPFIFNKYYEFFYKGANLNNINQTMLSNFLENFDVWSWFKTLTSSTFSDNSLFLNATQLGLKDFGNSQLIKNWLPFLSSTKPYIVETLTIKRQLEWLICPITFELKHNPNKFQVLSNRKKFIKCKLLRNTMNSSGHLLLYLFPPDHFNKEPHDISNSFLSDWSLKLPGTSILVPELIYDKNEKFITPLQLQDVLDVYLWAIGVNRCANKSELLNMTQQFTANNSTENLSMRRQRNSRSHSRSSSIGGLTSYFNNSLSSNSSNPNHANSAANSNVPKNSEQVLDGIPEHITLSGDKSGGNLACALLLMLNDLRTKFNCKDVKLPNALVLAYTPFNLRDFSPIMLTSRFNYSLSPIIALTTVQSNLPLPEIEEDLAALNESISQQKLNVKLEKSDLDKLDERLANGAKARNGKINQQEQQKERMKRNEKKRSNSMNQEYLVERLNECKLTDFFQQFGYLDERQGKAGEQQERGDSIGDIDEESEEEDEEEEEISDSDDVAYNHSTLNELNLSYFAKSLINYLSQYYSSHISAPLNGRFDESDEEEPLPQKRKSSTRTVESKTAKSSRPIAIDQRNQLNGLRPDLEQMKKFSVNNQTNESLLSQVQNAFTMFRLFFNGSEKKSTEFEWNKEIAQRIFTEQREKAFQELTSRPYISPFFYDDFQSLENVAIYLLNSTCDMFLDDNICMARKWKGE